MVDTNIFVAAARSRNPTSPTIELLKRWARGEFELVVSRVLLEEIVEKLLEHGVAQQEIQVLLAGIRQQARFVDVPTEAVEHATADPDDDHVLACAVVGGADYLVTYDPHIRALGEEYRGVKILDGLHFLYAVRGDKPP